MMTEAEFVSKRKDNVTWCRPADGYLKTKDIDLDGFSQYEDVQLILPESDESWPKGAPFSGYMKVGGKIMKSKGSSKRFTLLENSLSFFNESISCSRKAALDEVYWKFTILHLVQAVELAIKEALRRVHPVLVFENVDQPTNSVSITKGLHRLMSDDIGRFSITEKEKKEITRAIKMRNELVHYEVSYSSQAIEAKFASVYAFVFFFYRHHLSLELAEIMSTDQYLYFLGLEKTRKQLLNKAREFLSKDDVGDIWECPECQEDFFIVDQERCCFCESEFELAECPNCSSLWFEDELIDISNSFESYLSEGLTHIVDDYGYSEGLGCENCISKIKEDIENQDLEKQFDALLEDESREDLMGK